MYDFPFFSRMRNEWRLWVQNGRFPIFFPDIVSLAIVDPKWTISHFCPGRDISGDCGSKMDDFPFFCRTLYQWRLWIQDGRFPFFFPGGEINGDRIVDPKWTVSHFFLGRDISGDCGSKMDDFPFFSRTRHQWRFGIQNGRFSNFFFRTRYQWRFGIQSERFPIFFPDAKSMAIVDPKWMIFHFFPQTR